MNFVIRVATSFKFLIIEGGGQQAAIGLNVNQLLLFYLIKLKIIKLEMRGKA